MDRHANLSHNALLAIGIIVMLLLVRLWLLSFLPVYDTTEARYAEIARIMYETQNWVTPQIDYQQPFWGKPPLHTWMSAASFSALGISSFAARLPHFICGLLVLALVYQFAGNVKNRSAALLSGMVLTSSLGFIVAMGAVMTDIALLFSITLAMTSYWGAYTSSQAHQKRYGWLFFASLALGMLAKGPVAIVLVGIALCTWSLWNKNLKQALSSLPWISGLALFILLTLPWYLLAEQRTPGFLEYFILGEHVQRFVDSGWQGDLYGSAHDKPRGMIWLYWLLAAFPWSFFLIVLLVKRFAFSAVSKRDESQTQVASCHNLTPYLICWMLSPMLIFTFSGNILATYVLPGFPAMALLFALHGSLNHSSLVAAGLSLALLTTLPVVKQVGLIDKTSEIELLGGEPTQYAKQPLLYWKKRPYSARFYSEGQARLIDDYAKLVALSKTVTGVYIAAEHHYRTELSAQLAEVCVEQKRTQDRFLLYCRGTE